MLLCPPGVYRAEDDTALLSAVIADGFARGRRVLDIGTGSGALALAAWRAGATAVTAVDLSRRCVLTARLNSRLRRAPVRVRRGDLFAPVRDDRFDLVVTNPPYVPAATAALPRFRRARSWDAGCDGRALLDRICAEVGDVLAPGGVLLLVQSALCDADRTLETLGAHGLTGRVLRRAAVPFGPVLRSRAALLESRGMIRPGQDVEELVVIGATAVHRAA